MLNILIANLNFYTYLIGKFIQEIISYKGRFSYQEEQLEDPSFIQTDDGISFEKHSSNIININDHKMNPDQMYKCVMLQKTVNGLNDVKPLLDYMKTLPTNVIESYKKDDNCLEAKHILWNKIVSIGGQFKI